ncbi:MAG: [FeFe] hydrogenase H-cluster radical SAM maturase HydE [Candidatus Omnitrophota bacterium]
MSMSKTTELLNKIYQAKDPAVLDIEYLLSLDEENDLKQIFNFADRVRKEFCGDAIFLRGIIEFSNFCNKECAYCGLGKFNHLLLRYRMSKEELFKSVEFLVSGNIKTVVLQSGDDLGLDSAWLAEIILAIKSRFDIAITLSVGEKTEKDYCLWRKSGADRYLLKIETSDEKLYTSMHPQMNFGQRLNCLKVLRQLGYQVGSGNIIGLPGQTLKTLAEDIVFFKTNDFDMIGIGPFICHPASPFAGYKKPPVSLVLKVLALTRIVTKNTYLPATTALGSLADDYRLQGLECGANVLMPNFTPQPYRKLYEIYPQKKCIDEEVGSCNLCMHEITKSLGRFIDYSKADSLKQKKETIHV